MTDAFMCDSAKTLASETVKLCGTKKKEKELRKELAELARNMRAQMLDFYRNSLKVLEDKKDDNSISDTSMVRVLLSVDGKFLHPTFAILRLCFAYKAVKDRIKDEKKMYQPPYKDASLPISFLKLDEKQKARSAYAKLGEDRFAELSLDDSNEKLADDELLLRADLNTIYIKMLDSFKAVKCKQLNGFCTIHINS